jgi:hypothetical protein
MGFNRFGERLFLIGCVTAICCKGFEVQRYENVR